MESINEVKDEVRIIKIKIKRKGVAKKTIQPPKVPLAFLPELTSLFSTPKTLRSMKNTTWEIKSNHSIGVTYYPVLKMKAKDYPELRAIMNKWNMWSNEGKVENILKNEDGDIIFNPKYDVFENNYSQKVLQYRQVHDAIESCKRIIRTETKLLNEPVPEYRHCSSSDKEKLLASRRGQDESSRISILKAEKKLPDLITKYNTLNEELAKELGYEFRTYEDGIGIECSTDGGLVLGEKLFEKKINTIMNYKPNEGCECFYTMSWRSPIFRNEVIYCEMPSPSTYSFENGYCYISIRDNFTIHRQLYMKKGVALPLQTSPKGIGIVLNDTLFYPEMFKVTHKQMKNWNSWNTAEERYVTHKKIQGAFMPYEECGVECFYVRLGYSSDGKKLPNFNRGTLDCLKYAWKLNIGDPTSKEDKAKAKKNGKAIKMPGKKDDLIKELMKL